MTTMDSILADVRTLMERAIDPSIILPEHVEQVIQEFRRDILSSVFHSLYGTDAADPLLWSRVENKLKS